MVAPTLLLVSCIGCPSVSSDVTAPPVLPCPPEQTANQNNPSVQGTAKCISTPEIAAAFQPEFSTTNQHTQNQWLTPQAIAPTLRPELLASLHRSTAGNWAAANPLLHSGSRGQAVVQLQSQLQQLGYAVGAIDGVYGPLTKAAVKQFQQAQGVTPDGVVGPKTRVALNQLVPQPKTSTPASTTPATASKPEPKPGQSAPFPSGSSHSFEIPKLTVTLPVAAQQLLITSWTIIYIGGWLLILKDRYRELQGTKTSATPTKAKPLKAALRPVEATQPDLDTTASSVTQISSIQTLEISDPAIVQPVDAPLPIQQSSSHSTEPAADSSPLQAERLQAGTDQPLEVRAADAGVVHPLKNLGGNLAPSTSTVAPRSARAQSTPKKRSSSSNPSHLKPVSSNRYPDEAVIATLPVSPAGAYNYSLVEDASGLFVLRGHELRVIKSRLQSHPSNTSTITVRRIDGHGKVVDKSFKLEIQQMRRSIQAKPALAVG